MSKTWRVRCPLCGWEGPSRLPREGGERGDTTVWCPRRHKPKCSVEPDDLLEDGTCRGRFEEGEILE